MKNYNSHAGGSSRNKANLILSMALLLLATGFPGALRAQEDLRTAKTLTLQSAVLWHDDMTQERIQTFPDAGEFLAILSLATAPAQAALIRKPFTDCVRVEAVVDGALRTIVLPLPIPDGSGPYAFFVHPGTKGRVPQLVLAPEDAKKLGTLLRSFK
jgi:hypothetical protein